MASQRNVRAGGAFMELFLKDSKFRAGLKRTITQLKSTGRAVSSIGRSVAAAGSAVIAPMLVAVREFAKAGDTIDKMRQRTGLASEALSELSFVAEQSGASIDQLDRSLAAMARFSLMVSRGLATATDMLDLMGISTAEFNAQNPEERFKLMAEGISGIEDESIRAGVALSVFGRSGRELLPALINGRKGIEDLQKEARDLGLTLSGADTAGAAAFVDALNRVRRTIKAVSFQVGAALGPSLEVVLGKMT